MSTGKPALHSSAQELDTQRNSSDPAGPAHPTADSDPLSRTAAERFGLSYLFPYQRLVISNTLEACGCCGPAAEETAPRFQMALLPTGSGKTLCFTLPAVLLSGLTVVVFPLLALIADQQRRLERDGIPCARLTGGQSRSERAALHRRLQTGELKVLLSNPESLLTERAGRLLRETRVEHLVFDEVHTVCEWGRSFRPAYLEAGRIVGLLHPRVLTAFTATASEELALHAAEILLPGTAPHIIRANPDRPNITYSVQPSLMKMHDLTVLLQRPQPWAVPRPAIIFCRSRKSAELTAAGLRRRLGEKEVFFYHAGLSRDEKRRIEEWFFVSTEGVLAATTAYGMGVDKADIRTVIHRELSPSVEAFLQESGRAGRDGRLSHSLVLLGPQELQREQQLEGTAEGTRFSALLRVFTADRGCRREMLLALLGSRPEACFGCDLCAGAARSAAYGEREILDLLGYRPLRYSESVASRLLAGVCDHRSTSADIPGARFFGALGEAQREDISEALDLLRAGGLVYTVRRGPWRGLMGLTKAGRQRRKALQAGRTGAAACKA
jgi:ATP-dependent DNA helicase RecQ